jgi:hypothetical protein
MQHLMNTLIIFLQREETQLFLTPKFDIKLIVYNKTHSVSSTNFYLKTVNRFITVKYIIIKFIIPFFIY